MTPADLKTNWDLLIEVGIGPLGLDHTDIGKLTFGELTDMYNGYVWRWERERQDNAAQTLIIASGWGAKLTIEQLLGRSPYPALRSIQTVSSKGIVTTADGGLMDTRSYDDKIAEIEEVKRDFKQMGLEVD